MRDRAGRAWGMVKREENPLPGACRRIGERGRGGKNQKV
jgi:hypothetical protein